MSDDYTPTTENIRQTFAYVQAGLDHDDGYPFVMHVRLAEFDKWLAERDKAASARITELEAELDLAYGAQRALSVERDELTAELAECHKATQPGSDVTRADVWDEGALWAAVECGVIESTRQAWLGEGDNPYRAQGEAATNG